MFYAVLIIRAGFQQLFRARDLPVLLSLAADQTYNLHNPQNDHQRHKRERNPQPRADIGKSVSGSGIYKADIAQVICRVFSGIQTRIDRISILCQRIKITVRLPERALDPQRRGIITVFSDLLLKFVTVVYSLRNTHDIVIPGVTLLSGSKQILISLFICRKGSGQVFRVQKYKVAIVVSLRDLFAGHRPADDTGDKHGKKGRHDGKDNTRQDREHTSRPKHFLFHETEFLFSMILQCHALFRTLLLIVFQHNALEAAVLIHRQLHLVGKMVKPVID